MDRLLEASFGGVALSGCLCDVANRGSQGPSRFPMNLPGKIAPKNADSAADSAAVSRIGL